MSSISRNVERFGLFNTSEIEQIEQSISKMECLKIIGVNSLRSKLENAPDIETFRDYYLEGTYARIFAENNLSVTMEPCGRKGPDMLVQINGHNVYIEVKHLRLTEGKTNPQAKRVAWTIKDKLSQTLDKQINIIIICSDKLKINSSYNFEIKRWAFYEGLYLCKKLCYKNKQAKAKFLNLSCVVINLPRFNSTSKPIWWRFLQTSRKKVPPKVKARINTILSEQNIKAHQRIGNS